MPDSSSLGTMGGTEGLENFGIKSELVNFHHPYKPYEIQMDFMKCLYQTLESKKVGIFESPTGEYSTMT